MLMILARLVRSESFWAVVKVRSPHNGPEVYGTLDPRSDPSTLLMTRLVYWLEPSRRAQRTTPGQLRVHTPYVYRLCALCVRILSRRPYGFTRLLCKFDCKRAGRGDSVSKVSLERLDSVSDLSLCV